MDSPTTTRQFLLKRKSELLSTVGIAQRELQEIDVALAAMDKTSASASPHVAARSPTIATSRSVAVGQDPPINIQDLAHLLRANSDDQIEALLYVQPAGLTTPQVHQLLKAIFNRDMKQSSVSWYLSNLKRRTQGRVYLDGTVWKTHRTEMPQAPAEPGVRTLV